MIRSPQRKRQLLARRRRVNAALKPGLPGQGEGAGSPDSAESAPGEPRAPRVHLQAS
jgi:hypothetical protein